MRNVDDTSPERAELALVRSALAQALHADPPDLTALNTALGRVDKLLGQAALPPSAAGDVGHVTRLDLPVSRGFFAG